MSAVQGLDELETEADIIGGLRRLEVLIQHTMDIAGAHNLPYNATLPREPKSYGTNDGGEGEEGYPDTFNETWFREGWNVCKVKG